MKDVKKILLVLGLLFLLTDFEWMLLNPLVLSSLEMSSLGFFFIFILVLRLNSPGVVVSSVLSRSWEIGL